MFEDLTWLRTGVVIVVAMILQYVLLDQVVIFGSHPDLLIVLPATAGILAGAERGAIIGFATGIAADLILPTPFGLSMVVFVLVGYGTGAAVASALGREFSSARVSAAVLASALGTALFAVVAMIAGRSGVLRLHLFVTIAVVAGGALVCSQVVYLGWRWALRTSTRVLGSARRMPSAGSALRS